MNKTIQPNAQNPQPKPATQEKEQKPYHLLAWHDKESRQIQFAVFIDKSKHVFNGAFVLEKDCLANVSLKLPNRESPLLFKFGYDCKLGEEVPNLNPRLSNELEIVSEVLEGLKANQKVGPGAWQIEAARQEDQLGAEMMKKPLKEQANLKHLD